VKTLREAVEASWSRETSACPDLWAPGNPSRGQCAVTALVIQDYLGGDLFRGTVNGESHYWNRVFDSGVDWTVQQYGGRVDSCTPGVVRERSYVLSFPATVARYERLRDAVRAELAK
jgi:hypothetical protein